MRRPRVKLVTICFVRRKLSLLAIEIRFANMLEFYIV